MWNFYLKRGSIWSVKSLNEYDFSYEGMHNGSKDVLVLSFFTNIDGSEKYTYLLTSKHKRPDKTYEEIIFNNNPLYIELDNLKTGDIKALDKYQGVLNLTDLYKIIDSAKNYFNLNKTRLKIVTEKPKEKIEEPFTYKIHKWGIDIYVIESNDIKIDDKKRLHLSTRMKEDIIYNSNTEEDIRILSDKYQIYPVKAIKELRSRLIYEHKQHKG